MIHFNAVNMYSGPIVLEINAVDDVLDTYLKYIFTYFYVCYIKAIFYDTEDRFIRTILKWYVNHPQVICKISSLLLYCGACIME